MPADHNETLSFKIRDIKDLKNTEITILDVDGTIDISTTPDLQNRLNEIIRQKKYRIVVNLNDVTYVSSTGWGLFISLIKNLRNFNGDLKLAALRPEVKDIFDMTSLSKLISSYDTVDEALEAF